MLHLDAFVLKEKRKGFLLSKILKIFIKLAYLQILLTPPLLLDAHPLLVLLVVLPLGCLQVEPGVAEGLDEGEKGLDEGVEFVLKRRKKKNMIKEGK